jgi:hypothetical protein
MRSMTDAAAPESQMTTCATHACFVSLRSVSVVRLMEKKQFLFNRNALYGCVRRASQIGRHKKIPCINAVWQFAIPWSDICIKTRFVPHIAVKNQRIGNGYWYKQSVVSD